MNFSKIFCTLLFMMKSLLASKIPVVVIGGGLAGLTAAYRLQENGIETHVYEARSRVGGRIFTVQVNQHIGELGGQNISDGGAAENIRNLAHQLQLELISDKMDLAFYYLLQDRLVPEKNFLEMNYWSPKNLKERLEFIAKTSSNMLDVLEKIIKKHDTLFKILKVKLASYEGASIDHLSSIYIDTLYYMLMGGLSFSHPSKEEDSYLDHLSVKGGNSVLTNRLGEILGDKLHTNRPLKRLSQNEDLSYNLIFENGESIIAEKVILAIPCSVYEDIEIQEGIIPPNRLSDIRNIQYGTNSKIIVPLNHVPQNTSQLINDRVIAFFNADHQVINLYYTEGADCRLSANLIKIYQEDLPLIKAGLGIDNLSQNMPVLAKDEFFMFYNVPVAYSWLDDPYAKGSYSYIAPGQEVLMTEVIEFEGESVKSLFTPIQQTLYFAGEHTSVLVEVAGTMEAACESGEKAARMILKNLGKRPSRTYS